MIQASVNAGTMHKNELNKRIADYMNRAASEEDRNSTKLFGNPAASCSPTASRVINLKNIQNKYIQNGNNGGVINVSPKKNNNSVNVSRNASLHGNNISNIVQVKEFQEDIFVSNFKDVEKRIGRLDTERISTIKNRQPMSDHMSSFVSMNTTGSKDGRHHTNPTYDGWKDFCKQFVSYIFSFNIIVPTHPFKLFWDKLILILLFYIAVEIPLHTSFHFQMSVVIELIVTCMFIFDMWISFRTTYMNPSKNEYETNKKLICQSYLHTWFIVDFFASMPFDEVAILLNVPENIETIFAGLKLLRLLKLIRIFENFTKLSHKKGFAVLAIIFLILSHWGACLFHIFGNLHPTTGWLIEDDLVHKPEFERYISAFYWAMSSITTIGYGDIHAITFDERIFSCFMVIISAIVYSILLATMSLILGEIYHTDSEFSLHTNKCKKYCKSLKLSQNLTERLNLVNNFIKDYKYESSIEYLFNKCNLPNSIKYQIIDEIFKPIIETNITFKIFTDNILLYLVENLIFNVSIPNEYLFKYNDINTNIYIIQQGLIRIFDGKTTNEIARLKQGEYFNDIPLFKQDQLGNEDAENENENEDEDEQNKEYKSKLSPISAVSHTFCILYSIHYTNFKEILLINPNIYQLFYIISLQRSKQTNLYDDSQLCEICYNQFIEEQQSKYIKLK